MSGHGGLRGNGRQQRGSGGPWPGLRPVFARHFNKFDLNQETMMEQNPACLDGHRDPRPRRPFHPGLPLPKQLQVSGQPWKPNSMPFGYPRRNGSMARGGDSRIKNENKPPCSHMNQEDQKKIKNSIGNVSLHDPRLARYPRALMNERSEPYSAFQHQHVAQNPRVANSRPPTPTTSKLEPSPPPMYPDSTTFPEVFVDEGDTDCNESDAGEEEEDTSEESSDAHDVEEDAAGTEVTDSKSSVDMESPDANISQDVTAKRHGRFSLPCSLSSGKPNTGAPQEICFKDPQSKGYNLLSERPVTMSSVPLMATQDEDGFYEAFIGVHLQKYPRGMGRQTDVAGYGVWFADGSKGNVYGALDSDRPQYTKVALIAGSTQAIQRLKKEGYKRARLNITSDYLQERVLGWLSKYIDNESAPPSSWDEVKYHPEILTLCRAASGMVLKWSLCQGKDPSKRLGIARAVQLAKKATISQLQQQSAIRKTI